jgi:TRAP-type C4-dicarboxylate transport system permease small subunit
MAERGIAPAAEAAVGAFLQRLARCLALFGGVVLAALALMTVASIIGRAFIWAGLGPVPGDFELVQAGCAVAVFSFLPWCQINRGHVSVDIVVDRFSPRKRAFFALLGDIALATAAILIAWRLYFGLLDKLAYGEETYILGMPVWYGYALSIIGAILFSIVAVYTVWRGFNEMISGQPQQSAGAH